MKAVHANNRHGQKPIKYKQFIQQLQNSSRSSHHDQSILSQRSFRQSNTLRQNNNQTIDNNKEYKNQRSLSNNSKLNKLQQIQKTSYKIIKPAQNIVQQKQDKLYTFCDAKHTQKSVQIHCDANLSKQQNGTDYRSKKYFKTKKSNMRKNQQQKQNLNFVNQIIQKVESGFQGKVLKTQTQRGGIQSYLQSRKNSFQGLNSNQKGDDIVINDPKMISSVASNSTANNNGTNQNQTASHRKIQSVKKIFVISRPSNSTTNKKRKSSQDNKSRQSSLNKKQNQPEDSSCKKLLIMDSESSTHKQYETNLSSKKKILSFNINPLLKSGTNNNYNKCKLKLSLDKSYQSKYTKNDTSLIEPSRNLTLTNSLQKMPSLQQSKIQSLHHESSKNNLFLQSQNGNNQLKQLANLLKMKDFQKQKQKQKNKQISKEQQILQLKKIIEQLKDKENKLIKQISSFIHGNKLEETLKQLQIIKKDCSRLNTSYRQIKKLYEMSMKQKQDLQNHIESFQNQNKDLKQCLQFKKNECFQLQNKIEQLQNRIYYIQQQSKQKDITYFQNNQDLCGLSQMIKQKIYQYESQVSSLMQANERLIIIREKLQNYNMSLKQQIEQKDNLIWQLQRQNKQVSQMRRSCRDEVMDVRQNQTRLSKMVKQLESKLKLCNIHNQYLTKQLVFFKNQKQLNSPLGGNSPLLVKFGSVNTLANTITTRNSSISMCHGKEKLDTLINNHLDEERSVDTRHYETME